MGDEVPAVLSPSKPKFCLKCGCAIPAGQAMKLTVSRQPFAGLRSWLPISRVIYWVTIYMGNVDLNDSKF